MPLPARLMLEVVTPEGLLLREDVDHVQVPGHDGYFGVLPGHTPVLATLGMGSIAYRKGGEEHYLTCFWGFCEVLPDRVNILAEIGERSEDVDRDRAEAAMARAAARLKTIQDEAGYRDAHEAYMRALTRLSVAEHRRG